jgi:hypothetical protein
VAQRGTVVQAKRYRELGLLLAQGGENPFYIGPLPVILCKKPLADFTISIYYENCGHRDALPHSGFRNPGLDQSAGTNDIRFCVSEKRVRNSFISRELLVNIHPVFGNERDVVSKLLKSLMFCIPGDRLAFTARSPIQ